MELSNWNYVTYDTTKFKQKNTTGKTEKRIWLLFFLAAVLLNIIIACNTPFCDWYIKTIFPFWIQTYGRFCALFPYSVGERMLCIALCLIILAFLVSILRILGRWLPGKNWYKRLFCIYGWLISWIFLAVVWIMTLNCTVLYHASTFDQKYMPGTAEKTYTSKDFIQLRNFVVHKLNTLAPDMDRDASGFLVYEGNIPQEAIQEMKRLGKTYDQLSGYYPISKPIYFSEFLSQQYMAGYYFPFSMESNYNDIMYISNLPSTICHELSHLKGFIYEDEANFIAYLACVTSKNPFFQYSGYLSVYNYIERDLKQSVTETEYQKQEQINELVKKDNIFLTKETWEQVNRNAAFRTETVSKLSDIFTETSLKLNGVENGMESYHDVVYLLLKYYDGNA